MLEDSFENRFGIHPESGQLYAYRMLNREDRDEYDLVVRAEDSGMISRSSTASIHLTVEDKNNNNPKFTKTLYKAYIRDPTTTGRYFIGQRLLLWYLMIVMFIFGNIPCILP